MEIWNDIAKTVSDVAQNTVKGAEKLGGIVKMKYNIYLEESKLESVFINIGKLYCEDAQKNSDALEEQRKTADEIEIKLGEMKAELSEVTRNNTCKFCGAKVAADMTYCPRCGKKLSE